MSAEAMRQYIEDLRTGAIENFGEDSFRAAVVVLLLEIVDQNNRLIEWGCGNECRNDEPY